MPKTVLFYNPHSRKFSNEGHAAAEGKDLDFQNEKAFCMIVLFYALILNLMLLLQLISFRNMAKNDRLS